MARFKARHGLMLVHVVRFQIDRTEHVRLLSPASRPRGDELGYTENPSNALKDAGEAVPVAYQTLISREASARDDRLRRARVEEARVMIESGLRLLEAVGDEELRVPINAVRRRVDRLDRRLPDAA